MRTSIETNPKSYNWAHQEELRIKTAGSLEFHDVTGAVESAVAAAGVRSGTVTVQSLHTTAAIIVNEHEPLLLEDMKRTLERIASSAGTYWHDDFTVRTVNMTDDEEPNGHAHCKALFLPTSVTLNIWQGRIRMGRWQRIFVIELDRPRSRIVSILVFGC